MSKGAAGMAARDLGDLFAQGTLLGLSETELLARFREKRDEHAFRVLVERFGPMVRGVCRALIQDDHLADDAFQATFLVLVRKAGGIADPGRLGPWLYGVATRVARKASIGERRRRVRERRVVRRELAEPEIEGAIPMDSHPELMPLIHEELARMPARYREPIVLCLLGGQTQEEAARRLRCPVGTVKGRLWRGRRVLRERLARRGVALSLPVLVGSLEGVARGHVPEALVGETVAMALGWVQGAKLAGASSAAILLAERVVRAMLLTNIKLAATGVVGFGLVTATTIVLGQGLVSPGASSSTIGARGSVANEVQIPDSVLRDRLRPAKVSPVAIAKAKVAQFATAYEDGFVGLKDYLAALDQLKNALLAEAANDEQTLRQPRAKGDPSRSEAASESRPKTGERWFDGDTTKSQRLAKVRVALDRVEAGYLTGNMRIDQFIAASAQVKDVETAEANTHKKRIQALADHVARLQERLKREQARSLVSSDSPPNLAEVEEALESARIELAAAQASAEPASAEVPNETRTITAPPATMSDAGGTQSRSGLDDPRNTAALDALRKPATLRFVEGTTLRELVTFLGEVSKPNGSADGLQIYVDPEGLKQAEQTLDSMVAINLSGISLERALYLALRQIGLAYTVQEGLLIISTPTQLDQIIQDTPVYTGNWQFRSGGMGGGMGGMGGMGMGGMGGGFR
jgi:RNA polymerase sigma factor (sigma-70 family)